MSDDLIDRLRNPVTPTIYTLDCAAMRKARQQVQPALHRRRQESGHALRHAGRVDVFPRNVWEV